MSNQLDFLETGYGNTLQVKLNARRDDPAPSKRAAAKLQARAISKSLALFLHTLRTHGPMTVLEASKHTVNPAHWNHEWAKRVHGWHVSGHIAIAREEPSGRVWMVAP